MITRYLAAFDLDPVWTQFTNQLAFGPRLDPVFTRAERHVLRARARSFPPFACPQFVKQETKTRIFLYMHKCTAAVGV
jgi:hypothetical protein